ncbi:Putative uncharacterized protein [Moritella viscosa]|uniref:Uncharacterized protein n=2 Tax=Moritella viscosa TaxID=80854 RepID=A0A1L0B139_9GAMM|nr:Putative uncharacterized protein [Moritella viscosa]SGZ00073.1 Putative uncharacterized protein [Moritella viscosa]SGZ17662.1 Putative uncharacterized protein [Moritella viscosa]SHO28144.1 Putative uncharacterized protein [Moritella viscosa]
MLEKMGGYVSKSKSSSVTPEILLNETILQKRINKAKNEHPRTSKKKSA